MIGHESGQLVYVREIWGHASDQWQAQWSGGSLEAVGQGDGGAGISPASLKMALAGVLGLLMVGGTWEGQDWRFGKPSSSSRRNAFKEFSDAQKYISSA
jgi:hypothetical protein